MKRDRSDFIKADRVLLYISATLITIGIIFSYSLTSYTTLFYEVNQFFYFKKQLFIGFMGIMMIYGLSLLNPREAIRTIGFFIFFSMAFLMFVMYFLPTSYVNSINGAKRWIRIFGFSFAPVEFLKIGFIYFLAWSFNRRVVDKPDNIKKEIMILLPYFFLFTIIVFLIVFIQNDLGQVLVLGLVLLCMLLSAGTSFMIIGISMGMFLMVAIFSIVFSAHRILRVKRWWSGVQDIVIPLLPENLGQSLYMQEQVVSDQIHRSLNAIYNGGLFGQGVGLGKMKLGFLPEVHTDFVLSGIFEEIGFIGVFAIVFLFYLLIRRILFISARSSDGVLRLFTFGIAMLFLFTFLINAYGISSISPIKGIAVPFLSYGGSQLLASCFAIGLVVMASKEGK